VLSRWSGVDNGNVPGEVTDVTPTARAAAWLSCLGDALVAPDIGAAVALFGRECYWRDLLTFTWNIKTMEGHEAIIRMLEATLAATAPSAWTIVEDARETDGVVEAWFTFETGVARGTGRRLGPHRRGRHQGSQRHRAVRAQGALGPLE
jgi:hypothetical protein